ncbi:MAG: hypothetical protein IJU48_02450 [Synergistaceae bacterium]|nr:hypothetical protein [Synergistaceae bacterium]
MRKFLCVLILLILSTPAFAASNSSDAFMSLPFGHTFARTQKRMENSGAKTTIPRKESLTMEGYFEGYPAMFVFNFHKNKLLKFKAVYLQSLGDKEFDQKFYEALQKGFNAAYGSGNERPTANTRSKGKIMLQNVWTPDRYTTITLTYNPEMSKRFPGSAISSRFIHLIYKTDKWE